MMTQYLDNLRWRYATKKFDPAKKLTGEQVDFLKESIRLAPSSFGLQPWRFYLVKNPATRAAIRKVGDDQPQVTDASHFFVVTSRTGINETDIDAHVANTAAIRQVPIEKLAGFKKSMVDFIQKHDQEFLDSWCARQSYIALGFLLSACAQNQIDACPMEGFNPEAVTKILPAESEGYFARAFCAVGYRAADDKYATVTKVRFPVARVVHEIL